LWLQVAVEHLVLILTQLVEQVVCSVSHRNLYHQTITL
jgi:hypothetical protein